MLSLYTTLALSWSYLYLIDLDTLIAIHSLNYFDGDCTLLHFDATAILIRFIALGTSKSRGQSQV